MRRSIYLLALATLTVSGAFAQGADDCANAQPISGLGPHPFDNTSATPTPGLSDCNGLPVRKDVWFLWTAPQQRPGHRGGVRPDLPRDARRRL